MQGVRFFAVAGLLFSAVAAAQAPGPEPDWAESPEAYFLTKDERAEWKELESRGSREGFKERYWLKRDPTPGTPANEFREGVLNRIRTADARFSMDKTPGSRTGRGLVFIVFGTPARQLDSHAPPPAQRVIAFGSPSPAVGYLDGTETETTWIYDRERTPKLVEALGRPSLEVRFVVEPNKRKDQIQNPGLVNEYREVLARRTIVNPDLVAAAAPPPPPPPEGASGMPRHALLEPVRRLLDSAPLAVRSESGAVFGSAILWRDAGAAETLVWFFLPEPAPRMDLHARVVGEDGREVATLSERAELARQFSSHSSKGGVVLRRLDLPPGAYSASFVLTAGGEAKSPIASGRAKFTVPALEGEFAVSSLLLTRGPGTPDKAQGDPFAIGEVLVPPRADAVFSEKESLWYFVEVATPGDPDRITLEVRLRKGTGQTAIRGPFPAAPKPLSPGRYLCGFELPLTGLDPGDYLLYVVVTDPVVPAGEPAVRRADFRLQS